MPESTRYSEGAVQLRVGSRQRCAAFCVLNLSSVMIGLWQHSIQFRKELVYWAAGQGTPRDCIWPWVIFALHQFRASMLKPMNHHLTGESDWPCNIYSQAKDQRIESCLQLSIRNMQQICL